MIERKCNIDKVVDDGILWLIIGFWINLKYQKNGSGSIDKRI